MPAEQQRKTREPGDRTSLAEICATIGKETRTMIDSSRSGLTKAYTFVIKGEEADIATARRRLWSRLADTITVALPVPESCLGIIIGPAGKQIGALMSETSTRITVPKPYDGNVLVMGDFEGISLARARIEALISERINKLATSLTVERPYLMFMMEAGPSGKSKASVEQLHALAAKHDVKLVTRDGPDNSITINLSGDKKKVTGLKEYLESKYDIARATIKSVSTHVSKPLHRFLIGPKGETLTRMEEETGCLILVPPPLETSAEVTIYGSEGALLKGLQLVLEKTASFDSQSLKVSDELTVRLLLNRCRKAIRDLESKYDVQVHAGPTEIRIDGRKAEVTIASMEVKGLLREASNLVRDTLPVRPDLIKHVIGKKGHTLEQIQTDYQVDLIIPEAATDAEGDGETMITVAGTSKEIVAKAIEHLKQKLHEIGDVQTIELPIEEKFIGSIIGHKGAHIKVIRERYPETFIELPTDKTDHGQGKTIVLRGPSQEVAKAVHELESTLETLKHEAVLRSYTVEIPLTSDQTEAIVDRAGEVRKSLAARASKEFNVKVTYGQAKNRSLLQVQGLKADVDAAKPALEKLVREITDSGSLIINIPHEYHSLIVGKGGRNVRHLQQKYDVKIVLPPADHTEEHTVSINGPKANLKAVQEEILEFVEYERTHRHSETITVPTTAVPLITGTGGLTIMSICEDTDTRIDIDKEQQQQQQSQITVAITGSEQGVTAAKARIDALVEESRSLAAERIQPAPATLKLLTSAACVGAWRSLVAHLESGQPPVSVSASEAKGDILVRGPVQAVTQAVKQIRALLEEMPGFVIETVKIPNQYHREIIGMKGENIRKLRDELQVSISVPRSFTDENITVAGRQADVSKARKVLLGYIRETRTYPMAQPHQRDLVQILREEMQQLGISVSREGRDGLTLMGSSEALTAIDSSLGKALERLQRERPVEHYPVLRQYHGALIGRGGRQIEAIRTETGCQVHVPGAHASAAEAVELCGSPEAIEKAKAKIDEIIAGLGKEGRGEALTDEVS